MTTSLGIHLGTENLDAVLLGGSFTHPDLISFANMKLPAQSNWRNLLRVESPPANQEEPTSATPTQGDYEAVAAVIRSCLVKMGARSSRAYISVSPESVVVRYFQMPAIPTHERKTAIAFEAKKYLPFKPEELITDYQAIIRRTDPSLMRIMFFGIKRSALSCFNTLFKMASLTPIAIEPASISLVRLVRQNGQLPGGQVAAVLNIERDNATISIAREELLYLSRNVSIFPTQQAAEGPSPELLEALVTETRVSVDYYRRRFLGEPAVGKVIVFGRVMDPARREDLSRALELPVEVGNPFKRISGSKSPPEGLWTAAGLALRGLERKTGEINLLPPEQRISTQNLLKPAVGEALLALLILGAWYACSLLDLSFLERKTSPTLISKAYPTGIDLNSSFETIRDFQSTITHEIQLLRNLTGRQVLSSQLLDRLAALMPEEIWLQRLFLNDFLEPREDLPERHRLLRLHGAAFAGNRDQELERINTLLAKLREDPLFKTAFGAFSLDSVQRGTRLSEETTDFTLTCASHPEDLRVQERGPSSSRRRPL